MLTFTSLGDGTVRLSGPEKSLIVFPQALPKDANSITLLAVPERERTPGVVSWPGEYNMAGVSLKGIGHLEGKQVSFVVKADGVRMAFLSAPLQDWFDEQLESVGDVDVLVLPTSEPKLAQKLIDEFDPRVLILVQTGDANISELLKSVGATASTPVSDFKLKGQLPQEGREVVVLSA
jgi:hypothetical protein